MNIFNRIVMIIGILVWLFLILFLMIRPEDAISYLRAGLQFLEENAFDPDFFYIYLGILAALELILLILLWLEIRRTRRKTVRIKTQSGSSAELQIQSVAQSLEYRIDELPGVRSANTHITSRGRDVDVAIDLDTSPSVNIPVLTDQIVNLAHEIVEKQLGVKIHGKVNIRVRHEPYPRGTMQPTVPLGEEPVVPPGRAQAPAPTPSAPAPAAPMIRSEPRAIPSSPPAEKPLPTAPEMSDIEGELGEEEEEEGKESPSGW